MNKKLHTILILCLMCCLNAVADEAFYYPHYEVEVRVHADNSYSVKEKMHTVFTQERHGIVRDFPTTAYVKRQLPDGNGGKVEKLMFYNVDFRNVKVSEEFSQKTEDGIYALRIGNADKYVTGDHDYEITFDYKVGDDRTEEGDLFFYSLLGTANETNVDEFVFRVRFDKSVPEDFLKKLKLFYGPMGDETNRAQTAITLLSDTLITGRVTGLKANDGVTMFLPLPENYYSLTVKDEPGYGWTACLTFVIAVLALIALRETKSRNNFTKVIECWPPKGLTSADIGYIYDTSVDPCDIISLVPAFAHRGLLTIDTTSGHPVLHKKAPLPANATEYERKLYDGFFGKGDTFNTNKPTSHFAERWLDMPDAIKNHNKGMANDYAWIHICLSIFAYFVMLVALIAFDRTGSDIAGLYGMGIMMFLGWIGLSSITMWDASKRSRIGRFFLLGSWAISFAIQALMIWSMIEDDEVYILPDALNILTIIYALMAGTSIFAFRLTSMGKERLKHIGEILGLKEFIEKSEKPLLDSLSKEHEQYFYDILPYAVAFGLSDKWAKQFDGLNVRLPEWYKGNNDSLSDFATMMAVNRMYSTKMSHKVNAVNEARIAAEAKSAASSHGSGGFSGGGFGGGGSHSW